MPITAHLLSPGPIVWELAQNASLLIALLFVRTLLPSGGAGGRFSHLARRLALGLALGLIGAVIIAASVPVEAGMVLDTRSVLMSLSALFFGTLPSLVAFVLMAAYRVSLGGGAVLAGVLVLAASLGAGLLCRRLRKPDLARIGWAPLLAFGLAVHAVMMAILLLFHRQLPMHRIGEITLVVLGAYPLVTAILGKLLSIPLQREAGARLLRESEERLNLVLKGSNDGWWDCDIVNHTLTCSSRWWTMLGLVPGERPATPGIWRELVHPDDAARVEDSIRLLFETRVENHELEHRMRHRDGGYLHIVSRCHVIRNAVGAPVRISGTNVDITPLRRALDEANAAKAWLESAGRIGRVGYWELRFDGSGPVWSDMTCRIHGVPEGTRPALADALAFYPPEWRPVIGHDLRLVREQGRAFESEYEILTAQGRRIWVQSRGEPLRDHSGAVVGVRGVFQDIDARRRAAEALRQSERNYRELFDATTDAILIHDERTGRILDVNQAMLRMYGFADKASVLSLGIADLSSGEPPFDEEGALENLRAAVSGATAVFTWRARRADGGLFWAEVVLRRATLGGRTCLLASVRDITRRLALEQRLRETDKMESLGRLAGGIAHDFNNMLGVIIGHADLARARIAGGGDAIGEIDRIRDAAQRSAALVRQLLAFARRQEIAPKSIDLNLAVDSTLALIRCLLGENITIDWSPGPDLWPVRIDPVQVDQILANLALNARDAIAGAGVIRISTRNIPAEDRVLLEVSDDGCGMDAATLKRIFEPFFTTKDVGKGTGLGLATIYGIVEQNHGSIDVRSQPGRGAAFLITLPRAVAEPAPAPGGAPSASPPSAGCGHETILLVEDEPSVLHLTGRMLEMKGCRVLSAGTAEAALALARDTPGAIDLLVSDLMMPGMNGYALRAEILRLRPGLRTLFISGYSGDILPRDALATDSIDFLPKPFSADALNARVRALLDRPAPLPD